MTIKVSDSFLCNSEAQMDAYNYWLYNTKEGRKELNELENRVDKEEWIKVFQCPSNTESLQK